ncbi:hypothetical protein C1N58_12555 [Pantoea sp. SGAir0180]
MKAHYMRDDHLFVALPLDTEEALDVIYKEFCNGYGAGLLCTKHPAISEYVSAKNDWELFRHPAKAWLDNFAKVILEDSCAN